MEESRSPKEAAMPDGVAAPDSRTVVALSERVAVIETKVGNLKEDTISIRSSVHGINNEMQRFVAVEQQCVATLTQILEKIKDLPSIAQSTVAFGEMRADILDVIDDRKHRQGVAAFVKKFGMIVAAAAALVAVIGGIGGGWIWLAQHLKP